MWHYYYTSRMPFKVHTIASCSEHLPHAHDDLQLNLHNHSVHEVSPTCRKCRGDRGNPVCLSLQGLALAVSTVLAAAGLHSISLSFAGQLCSLLSSNSSSLALLRHLGLLGTSTLEHLTELLCACDGCTGLHLSIGVSSLDSRSLLHSTHFNLTGLCSPGCLSSLVSDTLFGDTLCLRAILHSACLVDLGGPQVYEGLIAVSEEELLLA